MKTMQKFLRILVCSLLITLSLTGCERRRMSQELKEFMTKTITIPNGIVRVLGRNVQYDSKFGGKPYLVIYHGPEECSTCVLSHNYMDCSYLKKVQDSGKCEVVVIFAPSEADEDKMLDYMRAMDTDFPLYFDRYDYFSAQNPDLPIDLRMHSFLIDAEGHPVFVGNPMSSPALDKLFWQVLNKL